MYSSAPCCAQLFFPCQVSCVLLRWKAVTVTPDGEGAKGSGLNMILSSLRPTQVSLTTKFFQAEQRLKPF